MKIDKPKPTEEEEVSEALLQLEGAPTEAEARDKCYIHLVTLLGDLQSRMLKTFEVIATQVADHGLRLDEVVKETSSLRKLLEENNTILKGVDARLKEVEKVYCEWRTDCERG